MGKLNFNLFETEPVNADSNLINILDELGKEICDKSDDYFTYTITTTSSDDLIFEFSLYILVPEITYEYRVINVEVLNAGEVMINFQTLVTKQIEKYKISISQNNSLYEQQLIKIFNNSLFVQSLKFLINQVNLKREYSISIENRIIPGEARIIKLKDGTKINAGFIKKKNNEVIFYTGLGLRTIWKPSSKEEIKEAKRLKGLGEEELMKQKYISKVNISDISKIY